MTLRSPIPLFLALFSGLACSSNGPRPGDPGADASVGQDGASTSSTADGGLTADAGPPRCNRDQDCASGAVCNVATGVCGAGVTCTGQADCDRCSAFSGAVDCGHGAHVNAFCDDRHGNVCVRGLAPCEPCLEDKDCGELHASIRPTGEPNRCLDYGQGERYCGRDSTFLCPLGFVKDPVSGQCKRTSGCSTTTVFCPIKPAPDANCPGTDQICPDTSCGAGGGICVNNDLPGGIGICIGACTKNEDCTDAQFPVCNLKNGICIAGCAKDSCPGAQVCHGIGTCGSPCVDDQSCETRFGPATYCNLSSRNATPRPFKRYRDENSCAPLGCERGDDCPLAGSVCDKSKSPPECVTGCYEETDCLAGQVCKTPGPGGPQPTYTREECQALAPRADPNTLGACCDPGCSNRVLDCGYSEWCCGQTGSPTEALASCGTVTASGAAPHPAAAGECFPVDPRPGSPFCTKCDANAPPCNSDGYDGGAAKWTYGYNQDPAINGGQPFKEQEFCTPISQDLSMCSVTCNPNAPDKGCPNLWRCERVFYYCRDANDCGPGMACQGAVPPDTLGKCTCNTEADCPAQSASLGAVEHPRCIDGGGGARLCLAAYGCTPPALRESPPGVFNYPAACLR